MSQGISSMSAPQAKAEPRKTAGERIRDAARDLFYRQGIRAVGVDELVAHAGVTKPSLYRAYASKDDLAAAYVRQYGGEFFERFEAAVAAHPGDPRVGVLRWFEGMAERAGARGYRGCGVTNALVEHPEAGHPARAAAEAEKAAVRARLRALSREMGARNPDYLGDALMLLMEGAFVTGQQFDGGGPPVAARAAAAALIAAEVD
jgi:AcrR family transcriptional regulator